MEKRKPKQLYDCVPSRERVLAVFEDYYKKTYKKIYGKLYGLKSERVNFYLIEEMNKLYVKTYWFYDKCLQNKDGAHIQSWEIIPSYSLKEFNILYVPSTSLDYSLNFMNDKHYSYFSNDFKKEYLKNAIVLSEEKINDYFELTKILSSNDIFEVISHTGVLYEQTEIGKRFIAEMEKY